MFTLDEGGFPPVPLKPEIDAAIRATPTGLSDHEAVVPVYICNPQLELLPRQCPHTIQIDPVGEEPVAFPALEPASNDAGEADDRRQAANQVGEDL